ncbi:TIGR04222 domain-containing membrane protein [Amycolatopsis sp. NPDC050768]|uniref:TIGR04222 domain-containing membrane protein n=1 Tax=Amycolatopsis sp. NPDC050768 TaxID=3154839 RepID=UPI0033F7BE83
MDETWGISGPQFLAWYGIALALVLAVQVVWPRVARTRAVEHTGELPDVYHLAYLAGGPERVADTAIAALVDRGLLRVNSEGVVTAAGKHPWHKIERSVHEGAKGAKGGTTRSLRAKAARSKAMSDLEAEMQRAGLLTSGSEARPFHTTILLAFLVLLAIGAVRFVTGASHGRPVGWLFLLLVVALVLTVVASVVRGRKRVGITPRGQGALTHARFSSRTQGAVRPALLLAGAAGAVALGGLAMYPDDELSAALIPPFQPFAGSGGGSSSGGSSCSTSSSCSSGSSCSSSSSCSSGSSCGGGGCGG